MFNRLNVQFSSGNVNCSAWLYLPVKNRPSPVIIMGHGLGAIREMRLDAYAKRFCAEGYACLVFDYRYFGKSEGKPRQLLDIKRQLEDWVAAIAYARSHKEIIPSKIILWGTSLGGGHVIVTAARKQNIAAVITQCPFINGLTSAMAMNWRSLIKVTALSIWDTAGSLFGIAPVMVSNAGAPGSASLMSAPGCESGYLSLVSSDATLFRNHVAARVALNIVRYQPGRFITNVQCPILFCICKDDTIAPAKVALRCADKALHGEIKLYHKSHFDIYTGESFEQVITDQLRFLRCHVPIITSSRIETYV